MTPVDANREDPLAGAASEKPNARAAQIATRALALLEARWLPWAIVTFGAALRVRGWCAGFSFEVAEAELALNIRARDFSGLTQPLDLDQGAPILFLWISRAALLVFGEGERVLRAWPLLCALASLVLLLCLARRVLPRPAIPVALLLAATSPDLVSHASTFKQYDGDVALTLGLLLLAWPVLERPLTRGRAAALAACGACALWLSHAAVLVLAAIGVVLVIVAWRRRAAGERTRVALLGASWAASLGVEYALILRQLTSSEFLLRYWATDFAPLPPTSIDDVQWYFDGFVRIFSDPTGLAHPGLAAGMFVLGVAAWWGGSRRETALLLLPFAFTLLASGLHQYPFGRRLILFLVPLLLLGVARGLEALRTLTAARTALPYLVLTALLLFDPAVTATLRGLRPRPFEETRPLFQRLAHERAPNDVLYLYADAGPAFRWYAPQLGLEDMDVRFGRSAENVWEDDLADVESLPNSPRVWLLFSHVFGRHESRSEEDLFLFLLDQRGQREATHEAPGATLHRYDLRAR